MSDISRRHLFEAAGLALAASQITACKPEAKDTQALTLECNYIRKKMGGKNVKLRSFNGTVPGPMIKTKPGQMLKINVKNSLPPYDSKGWPGNHNIPHALDTTNLHLHGLDIAPHLFEPL